MNRRQRELKHARRVTHQRQVNLRTSRTADELRNERRDARRASRRALPIAVRERPETVVHPPIPKQARAVTLAKRKARREPVAS